MFPAIVYLASLLSGLVAGIYLSVVINDARIGALTAGAYVAMHQMRDKTYRQVMPVLGFATLGGLTVAAALGGGSAARPGFAAAALLCAVDIAVAIRHQVPLNRRVQAWAVAAPPVEWAEVRDSWERAHRLRTLIGLVSFALCLWAASQAGIAPVGSS